METDIAAEVDAMNGAAGEFDELGNGLAHNTGVEVSDVKNFKRVGVGEFGDDGFARICVV